MALGARVKANAPALAPRGVARTKGTSARAGATTTTTTAAVAAATTAAPPQATSTWALVVAPAMALVVARGGGGWGDGAAIAEGSSSCDGRLASVTVRGGPKQAAPFASATALGAARRCFLPSSK